MTKLWGRTKRRKAEATTHHEVSDWLDSVAGRVDESSADLTEDDLQRRVERLKDDLRSERADQPLG